MFDLVESEEETCFDSLEDLKRGQGVRKLPQIPGPHTLDSLDVSLQNTNDSLEDLSSISEDSKSIGLPTKLLRSDTFISNVKGGRRKLPEIPLRGNFSNNFNVDHLDHGFFSLSDEKSCDTETGCSTLDSLGEGTSVDPPLLPKRNSTNYLWVDLGAESSVKRRPKNHDRLSQAAKAINRHSAPPGSLDFKSVNSMKPSHPERPTKHRRNTFKDNSSTRKGKKAPVVPFL